MDRAAVRLALGGGILFLALSAAVSAGRMDATDRAVDDWVIDQFGPTLRRTEWSELSDPGQAAVGLGVAGLGAFFALRAGAARTAAILLALTVASGVAVHALKDAYDRGGPDRYRTFPVFGTGPDGEPVVVGEESRFVPPGPNSRAYPSGHTMVATAPWGLALLLGTRAVRHTGGWDRAAVLLWAGVALAVGLNRIAIRSHYLSDVVASWALGASIVALGVLADDRWGRRPSPVALPPGPPADLAT